MLFLKCIYLHQPIPCTGISKFSMSNFVHEWKKSQPANFVSLQERHNYQHFHLAKHKYWILFFVICTPQI
jgi:hypothetical protein